MKNRSTTVITFLAVMALVFGMSIGQANAGSGHTLVPLVDSPFSFNKGKLKIESEDGDIKLTITQLRATTGEPAPTTGTLVLTLMVNNDDSVDVTFNFDVDVANGSAGARVRFKTDLTSGDPVLELVDGDVIKFLGAEVRLDNEPVAAAGVIFKTEGDEEEEEE